MGTIYCLIWLVLINVSRSYALECYSCFDIDDVNNCGNTTICRNGQSCYLDLKQTGASTSFSLGCKDNQMCGHPSSTAGELIGRSIENRQTDACTECCSTDNCNKHLCEHSKPSACIDDPKADCAWLNTIVNICQDIQHAKTVCSKFCGLCSLVDGNWAEWSQWSACDVTCERGTQIRKRSCTDPAPANGGLNCTGNDQEIKSCTLPLCPVHGGWSIWGQWEGCSVTCDIGIQRRHRNCSNPYPERFGDHCFGYGIDDRLCLPGPCANGGWSDWGTWNSCSTSCGGGIKSRTRECNNPFPSLSGKNCDGDSTFTTSCNVNPCSIPSIIFRSKDVTKLVPSVGDKLIFSTTTLNEGNAYDNKTGIFTAPMTGTYQFSARFCTATSYQFIFSFRVDNQLIDKHFIGLISSNVHCDTPQITIPLQKGSQVNLQCENNGKLYTNSDVWNTFSGYLLHL